MRRIDADALMKRIDNIAAHFAKSDQQKALIGRAMYCVDTAPTVDVAPAKGKSEKPPICVALGVEVGEVWEVGKNRTKARINREGKLEVEVRHGWWTPADVTFSQDLANAINDPRLVIHKNR